MKKKIGLVIVILTSIFMITGCGSKTALEPNDFVDLVEQKDYQTTNVIDQFSDYSQIKSAFIAQNKKMTYQIEYYELDTEENAKTFYTGNKDIFKGLSNKKSNTEVDLKNYQKYTQSTDNTYSLISRIDNTIIYVNAKIEYKDEINKIIKTLGY